MRRITMLVGTLVLAGFVATGCGKFGSVYTGQSATGTTGGGKGKISSKPFDAAAAKAAGCGTIESLKSYGRTHTTGPVKYVDNPPASGAHHNDANSPRPWGIYNSEQATESWVHNLEHGHMVVLYKGISGSEKRDLIKYVKRDPYHMVVMPRDKDPKPGIWIVAWQHRLFCQKPSAEALQEFVTQYRDQGPELFTTDRSMNNSSK